MKLDMVQITAAVLVVAAFAASVANAVPARCIYQKCQVSTINDSDSPGNLL